MIAQGELASQHRASDESGRRTGAGHVHLLFLPAYSPELHPAEELWSLTFAVLVNRHFATVDDLEEVQLAQCVACSGSPL